MGVRDTSIEAYREAIASGLINDCEIKVIEIAHQHWRNQGHTTRELMRLVSRDLGRSDWDTIQNYQKVIRPLVRKGVFEELEKRTCEVSTTNKRAYPVRLTYNPPQKIVSYETENQRLRKTINELKETIELLQKELSRYRAYAKPKPQAQPLRGEQMKLF